MKLLISYIMGAIFGAGIYFLMNVHSAEISSFARHALGVPVPVILASQPEVKGESTTVQPVPTEQTISAEDMKKERLQETVKSMSLAEKVGQLFMWQIGANSVSDDTSAMIEDTNAGGVIIMGERSLDQLTTLTDQLRQIETRSPLFIAIDQEGGQVKRLTDDSNPGPQALSILSEEEVCSMVENTSQLLAQAGVNVNFGIIGDIGWDKDAFIFPRTFGSSAEEVNPHVATSVRCSGNILSTVKHFPGHGRTEADTHESVPVIEASYDEWRESDAVPFQTAVEAGVDFVMTGHLIYSDIADEPASLSQKAVEEIRNMNFQGLVISDDLGMLEASAYDPYTSLEQALYAGTDILLYVRTEELPQDLYQYAVSLVAQDRELEESINERVMRILEKKDDMMGL